jgi:site-specific DNA-methyltransferase (adenine-specific)
MEINKIYNESNLDTMARMPDNFIDLTVTSPPYDGLRNYNGYSFPFEEIAKELYRVTKQGGIVVWVVGDATENGTESGTSFKQALFFKECGFNLHDTMIYHRKSMPLTHNRYEQWFEYMFILSKDKPKTFNPIKVDVSEDYKLRRKYTHTNQRHRNKTGEHDGYKVMPNYDKKIKENVWYIKNGNLSTKDKIAFQHPAIFPEQLANDHIISWSNENDLIYDPFMGSGTTAKMAILNKRNYIGSEISKEYCEIAEQRLKECGRAFF